MTKVKSVCVNPGHGSNSRRSRSVPFQGRDDKPISKSFQGRNFNRPNRPNRPKPNFLGMPTSAGLSDSFPLHNLTNSPSRRTSSSRGPSGDDFDKLVADLKSFVVLNRRLLGVDGPPLVLEGEGQDHLVFTSREVQSGQDSPSSPSSPSSGQVNPLYVYKVQRHLFKKSILEGLDFSPLVQCLDDLTYEFYRPLTTFAKLPPVLTLPTEHHVISVNSHDFRIVSKQDFLPSPYKFNYGSSRLKRLLLCLNEYRTELFKRMTHKGGAEEFSELLKLSSSENIWPDINKENFAGTVEGIFNPDSLHFHPTFFPEFCRLIKSIGIDAFRSLFLQQLNEVSADPTFNSFLSDLYSGVRDLDAVNSVVFRDGSFG
ncbi:MAG: hypothetical protein VW378_04705 [bacterium]